MALTLEITKSAAPELLRVGDFRTLEEDSQMMLKLGRGPGNEVLMRRDDTSVSRMHARIYFHGDSFFLVDSSANGTGLNDTVLRDEAERLSDGDRITIGPYEFQVLLDGVQLPPDDGPNLPPDDRPRWRGPDDGPNLPPDDGPRWRGPDDGPNLPPDDGPRWRGPDDGPNLPPDDGPRWRGPDDGPNLPPEPPEGLAGKKEREAKDDTALWHAFLRGAGMSDGGLPVPPDMAEYFEVVGHMFRAFVEGTIQLMRARNQLRNDFGLENTVFSVEENNPLKLSNNASASLHQLLRVGPQVGYMRPAEAVSEAMEALAIHEYGVIEASTSGLDALFKPLHPNRFEGEQTGRRFTLPLSHEKRAWRAYREFFEQFMQEREYVERFCRQFADAYEEVVNARARGESAEFAVGRVRPGRRGRRK